MDLTAWEMTAIGEPLKKVARKDVKPGPREVVIEVAGCGVCHTDLGFLFDGVPTRHPLPLVLGHEIAGRVVACGANEHFWMDADVIVPAVIPCGECEVCRRGRGTICPHQIFPGNDLDGGFATHVVVPARGLCRVPPNRRKAIDLAVLAVVADAVTTPYQACLRSAVGPGDLAIFVGIGGVGAFGVQIARAMGAVVVAIDIDPKKLERVAAHGAALVVDSSKTSEKDIKKTIRAFAKERGLPAVMWKIFETSGAPAGQQLAFSLLVHGATLSVVGYTPKKVEVPLSHLMAFDAVAQGNWGCLPENYPGALELVLSGKVDVEPFIERRPLSSINEALASIHRHECTRRVVLVPDAVA